MNKHEIPHHQWAPFLESFSLVHAGKLVSVQSRRPEQGVVIEIENKPLEALIQEAEPDTERIAIIFDQGSKISSTHFVCSPRQIRLRTTPEGAEEGVEIDADDGRTVLLQFCAMSTLGIEAA
jgi:Family of unknown function (DUF5335)